MPIKAWGWGFHESRKTLSQMVREGCSSVEIFVKTGLESLNHDWITREIMTGSLGLECVNGLESLNHDWITKDHDWIIGIGMCELVNLST